MLYGGLGRGRLSLFDSSEQPMVMLGSNDSTSSGVIATLNSSDELTGRWPAVAGNDIPEVIHARKIQVIGDDGRPTTQKG